MKILMKIGTLPSLKISRNQEHPPKYETIPNNLDLVSKKILMKTESHPSLKMSRNTKVLSHNRETILK
jgi:hypothetical protein